MLLSATRNGEKVRILDIRTTDADPATEILIVYCNSDGVIQVDSNPANFIITE